MAKKEITLELTEDQLVRLVRLVETPDEGPQSDIAWEYGYSSEEAEAVQRSLQTALEKAGLKNQIMRQYNWRLDW